MKPQVTRIAVVVMNNVLSSSLGITLDILNTAADLMKAKGRAELSVQVVSLGRASQMRSSSGLQISGLVPRTAVKQPDVVMLPGCNVNQPEKLLQWLHDPEVEAVRDAGAESDAMYDSDMKVYVGDGNRKGKASGSTVTEQNIAQMKAWAREGK